MIFFRYPTICVKALAFAITALTIVSVLYYHCTASWHHYSNYSFNTRYPYKVLNDAGILLSSDLTEKTKDFNLKKWNVKRDELVAEPKDVWQKTDSQNSGTRGWEEGGIPVVVVEEHHDVIPHWFTAVDLGRLPRRGNTLVHIDAHPDVVLPLVNGSFPLFRYPRSSELVYLMQRNDMFITSASLTGLFSRYIWITPPWDEKLKNALGSDGYRRFHISAGLLTQKAKENNEDMGQDANRPSLCYCMDSILSGQGKTSASDGHDCYLHSPSRPANPTGVTVLIQRSRCKRKLHILAEIVTETKALELVGANEGERPTDDSLSTDKHRWKRQDSVLVSHRGIVPWLSEDDSIILDIDEDYYGVESAITPLQNVQLDFSVITHLSEKISKVFCAENAEQEILANLAFTILLHIVRNDLALCRKSKTCVTDHKPLAKKLFADFWRLMKPYETTRNCVCSDNMHDVELALEDLVEELTPLEERQLKAVSEVGICLRHSPRTLGFEPWRGLRLCTGYNRPDNAVVQFHVPEAAEIEVRSKALLRLFSSSRLTPRLVTIARSVRDGYTPRGSFHRIEQDLLHILRNAYRQISNSSIVYDKYLLGGKRGRWI